MAPIHLRRLESLEDGADVRGAGHGVAQKRAPWMLDASA